MAKAVRKTEERIVQRLFTDTELVTVGVTLELSLKEARTLHTVLRLVGGHPDRTLRGVLDNVREELVKIGVGYFVGSDGFTSSLTYGNNVGIHFDEIEPSALREDTIAGTEEGN